MTIITLFRSAILTAGRLPTVSCVCASTKADVAATVPRNAELFEFEKQRQNSKKIEKVLVTLQRKEKEDETFLMNKGLSTPYHVAKHVSHHVAQSSALCIIHDSDGPTYMSMHSILKDKCTIELVNYQNKDHAMMVNESYWRSATFLLGAGAANSLQKHVRLVKSHSDVSLGHFMYDIAVEGLQDWKANASELATLSYTIFNEFVSQSLPFETLSVPFESAKEFELEIEDEMCDSKGNVTLCRVGNHVDVVDGPVIANTSQIGKFSVVKAFEKNGIVRLAGVSLPAAQPPSSYAWSLIQEHAQNSIKLL